MAWGTGPLAGQADARALPSPRFPWKLPRGEFIRQLQSCCTSMTHQLLYFWTDLSSVCLYLKISTLLLHYATSRSRARRNVSASVHVACNLDASAVHIKLTHSRCISTVPPCKEAKSYNCSSAQIRMHSNFEDGSTCIAFSEVHTRFTCRSLPAHSIASCSSLIDTIYGLISRASWVLLVF